MIHYLDSNDLQGQEERPLVERLVFQDDYKEVDIEGKANNCSCGCYDGLYLVDRVVNTKRRWEEWWQVAVVHFSTIIHRKLS